MTFATLAATFLGYCWELIILLVIGALLVESVRDWWRRRTDVMFVNRAAANLARRVDLDEELARIVEGEEK